MTTRKKPGGRREPPGGRPPKGNMRLVCYVRPETKQAIEEESERTGITFGEVVDRWMKHKSAGEPSSEQ